MPAWGWIGVVYGAAMAAVAITTPVPRRFAAVIACLLYALAAANFATLDHVGAQVILPAALTLAGYWLSGLFVRAPQPWLEHRLLESDRWLFTFFDIDRWLDRLPTAVLEAFEFVYSTVYVIVLLGAVVMAPIGRDAVRDYWAVVLPAELICCGALPFLRSRPPRTLEQPGTIARRQPRMRRVNDAIVERGSIQVNTIPSAHVAAALAAGLAVSAWLPGIGAAFIVMALLIAIAATVGRYHYAVDCALGAGVALTVWIVGTAFR